MPSCQQSWNDVSPVSSQVAGAPSGNGKLAGVVSGLGLKGSSSKFERFDDGLQMSESSRRMEGFGSGR